MQKLLSVTINDLRVTFNDRSVWLGLVVIPMMIMFLVGLTIGGVGAGGQARLLVDVINADTGTLSTQLLQELKRANPHIVLCPADSQEEDICRLDSTTLDEERAQRRLTNDVTRATIIIPQGFSEQALAGAESALIFRSKDQINQPGAVAQALQAVAQRMGGAVMAARVGEMVFADSGPTFAFADESDREAFKQTVYDRAVMFWDTLPALVEYAESAQTDNQSVAGFRQSVPGIGTMYVMANVLVGALILLQERKNWTFQRLLMMPVTPGQIIGGKMLARFIMGMVQYTVAFAFGFILGVRYGSAPLALLIIMVSFTLCCTGLSLLMATFIKTEQQAGSLLNLMILVLAPLGGAWWPIEIVPQWMQVVGHLSPIAWAMRGFRSVIFNQGGVSDVLLPAAVLLAMTGVFFLIAVRRFKYE